MPPGESNLFVYVGLALPCAFFVFLVGVSYLEKRLVDPYVEINPDAPDPAAPPVKMLSRYVQQMSDGALHAGFEFGGIIAHRKYPQVKIGGTVWLSPDGRTLMHTGSGTVLNMPAKQTWLVTPRRDGGWFVTTDQNDEGDASGLDRTKRVLNVSFEALWAAHQKRIDADPSAIAFPAGTPFALLSGRARSKAESMLERGIARYRDAEQQYWSYSFLASLGVIWRFIKQLGGAVLQIWRVNRPPIAPTEPSIPIRGLWLRWLPTVAGETIAIEAEE